MIIAMPEKLFDDFHRNKGRIQDDPWKLFKLCLAGISKTYNDSHERYRRMGECFDDKELMNFIEQIAKKNTEENFKKIISGDNEKLKKELEALKIEKLKKSKEEFEKKRKRGFWEKVFSLKMCNCFK